MARHGVLMNLSRALRRGVDEEQSFREALRRARVPLLFSEVRAPVTGDDAMDWRIATVLAVMVLASVMVHTMIGGCRGVVAPGHPLALGEGHDGAHAADLTDAEHTRGPQDELRCGIDADARQCHGRVCQPLCLRPGGVTLAFSAGSTRPAPLGVYTNVPPCLHTRHHWLGVTSGDSRSVAHAFLLECVGHSQRPHASSLLILSQGALCALRRVAVSRGLAQKEPPVPMGVGHLPCTVVAQDLHARFALYGMVDRLTLLTDRETGRPRGCGGAQRRMTR